MKQKVFNIFMVFFLSVLTFGAEGKCLKIKSVMSVGGLEFSCDSIDFRPNLTRVYGRLSGAPHTSNRIDDVKLLPFGAHLTDIDGVDIKRWFQWEDDGVIPVEIDFPAMKERSVLVMEAATSGGTATWTVETVLVDVVKQK